MNTRDMDLFDLPALAPSRGYWSDAIPQNIAKDTTEPIIETKTEEEKIKEDLVLVKDMAEILPDKIKNTIQDILQKLIDWEPDKVTSDDLDEDKDVGYIEVVIDDLPFCPNDGIIDIPKYPKTEEVIIPVVVDPDMPIDPRLEFETAPTPINLNYTVERRKAYPALIAQQYNQELQDIKRVATDKLQAALQAYIQETFLLQAECGLPDVSLFYEPYDGTSVSIPNKNLQHLGDNITRRQIINEQRQRFLSRTFSPEQTLFQIRSCLAAHQLRLRYYNELYGPNNSFIATSSNAILQHSRESYDVRYETAMGNLYKYLAGSATTTNDILSSTLDINRAKAALIKSGVDIFINKEREMWTKKQQKTTATKATAKTTTSAPVSSTQNPSLTPAAEDGIKSQVGSLSGDKLEELLTNTYGSTIKDVVAQIVDRYKTEMKSFSGTYQEENCVIKDGGIVTTVSRKGANYGRSGGMDMQSKLGFINILAQFDNIIDSGDVSLFDITIRAEQFSESLTPSK